MNLRFSVLVLLLVLSASNSRAQVVPHGPSIQVNTNTTAYQFHPDLAADSQGRFVVVWASAVSSGTDSSGQSVQAQRFDSHGNPLGVEFQVNTYTTSHQNSPAVAMSGQGAFVVAWSSNGSSGTDTYGSSVQAQRFSNTGTPLGGEFQVNTYTFSNQGTESVASDLDGNFVVVWSSSDVDGYSGLQARRFSSAGLPQGAEFQVETYTTSDQLDAEIAMSGNGSFVVTWTSAGSAGSDSSFLSVQARRFLADATPIGSDFQVNTYTTGEQSAPAVAMDSGGRFLIAWTSDVVPGTDTEPWSLQAQLFSEDGLPSGGQFQLNAYTPGTQIEAAVAPDGGGGFVASWSSSNSLGTDASGLSVQSGRLDASGAPREAEFQVNTYTTGYQYRPKVAADARGNFVVVWTSDGSGGTDHDSLSIQARLFDALFRDGFESGGTARWSSAAP